MVGDRRVVVTGVGVISSLGIGKETFWNGLLEGRSGVSRIEGFDTSGYDIHIGGEVRAFNSRMFLDERDIPRIGRATQFGIAASKLALEDSGLTVDELVQSAAALCLGTTMADAQALETVDSYAVRRGTFPKWRLPLFALQYPCCIIGTNVATAIRLKGRVLMIPTACAAGNYSIAYGYDLIRGGKCEVVLAGGVDALSRTAFTGFSRMFALAPEKCQPFDRNRKGIVVGEGSGVLTLESYEHASTRGARVYAEVIGYGMSCDAQHMTTPSSEGIARAIRSALEDAGIEPGEIDYINAHGTGTPANDRAECAAIWQIFGERTGQIPISSIKSMLGHSMGAASATEAIACVLAISEDWIPPTINHETEDPECAIDCVPNRARQVRVKVALNNSFAFGGNNCCVVFRGLQALAHRRRIVKIKNRT